MMVWFLCFLPGNDIKAQVLPAGDNNEVFPADTIGASADFPALQPDSLTAQEQKILQLEAPVDTTRLMQQADSAQKFKEPEITADSHSKKQWLPIPNNSIWLSLAIPGAGQIYNRKYWKLPIIYGGFAGCAYALSWNGKMYKDYSQAYLDIMDSNPNTKSYEDLLPPNSNYDEEQLKNTIKKRKDMFRRYRDLSIFAFIGVYIISIIDAYVDAELSNFDITPDLSMKVEPTVINNQMNLKQKSVGVQCVLRF